MTKASDLFIQCLEEEGVEYIFGVPGEENLDLLESLRKSSIERRKVSRRLYPFGSGKRLGHSCVTLCPPRPWLVVGCLVQSTCGNCLMIMIAAALITGECCGL